MKLLFGQLSWQISQLLPLLAQVNLWVDMRLPTLPMPELLGWLR